MVDVAGRKSLRGGDGTEVAPVPKMPMRPTLLAAVLLLSGCYLSSGPGDEGPSPQCEPVATVVTDARMPDAIFAGEPAVVEVTHEGDAGEGLCDQIAGVDTEIEGPRVEVTVTCECSGFVSGTATGLVELPPLTEGDWTVEINGVEFPITVQAPGTDPDPPSIVDPDGCELRESTPTAVEIAQDACTFEPVDVIVDHQAAGCGCNVEYGLTWSQSSYALDIVSEVRYCPERCYERECTDTFRSRGILLFETPGDYIVRAGSAESRIEIIGCY